MASGGLRFAGVVKKLNLSMSVDNVRGLQDKTHIYWIFITQIGKCDMGHMGEEGGGENHQHAKVRVQIFPYRDHICCTRLDNPWDGPAQGVRKLAGVGVQR